MSTVIAFLDANNLEHSRYLAESRDIRAIRRNTCWATLIQCDIEIAFVFDNEDRLQSISVTEGYTGL